MSIQKEISQTSEVIQSYLNSQLTLKELLKIIQQQFKQEDIIYKSLVAIIQASAYLEDFEIIAGKAMSLLRKTFKIIRWENFSNIKLQDCNMKGISFVDCNFKGSKIKNANITYCWFIGCCLDDVKWDQMINGDQQIFHSFMAFNNTKIAQKNDQKNICLLDIKSGAKLLTLKETFSIPLNLKFLTQNLIVIYEQEKKNSLIEQEKKKSFIQIWNAKTGKKLHYLEKIQTPTNLVGLNQKGFVFSRRNLNYYIYHFRNLRQLRQFKIRRTPEYTTLSQNCFLLAIKRTDDIQIWDFSLGRCIFFAEKQKKCFGLAFSPNGKQMAFSSQEQIELWNIKERKLENKISLYRVEKIVYSDDSQIIACQERDNLSKIYFFNSISGQFIQSVSQFYHSCKFQKFFVQNDYIFTYDAKIIFLNKNSLCQKKQLIKFKNKVQFDFISDGNKIAFFPEEGKAWLCDINNSKFQKFDNFKNLQLITYKAKREIIALVIKGHLYTIQLFDFKEKRKLSALKTKSKICSIDLSIDGRFLASGHEDFAVRIFDLITLSQVNILKNGHQSNIICVKFSHDSSMLISGATDGIFLLWNIRQEEQIAYFPNQGNDDNEQFEDVQIIMEPDSFQNQSVNICAAFSYDSEILVMCNSANIILWNIQTKQQIKVLKTTSQISMIAFQQDGLIAAITRLGQLIFFTSETEKLQFENFKDYFYNSLAFSSDGKFLVTIGKEQILLYDVYYQRQLYELISHKSQIVSIKVATQANILAYLDLNNFIQIQDCNKNLFLKKITNSESKILSIALSNSGSFMAYGCQNGTICLWDIQLLQQIIKINDQQSQVTTLQFSSNELHLVTGCQDGSIFILNIQLEKMTKILIVDSNSINEVFFINNDQQIGCLQSGCFQTFKVGQNFDLTNQFKQEGKFSSIALSPDQQSLALGEFQGVIRILDMNGKVIKELKIHEGEVKNITFSFDGKLILFNCQENNLFLVRLVDGTLVDKMNWQNDVNSLVFLNKHLNYVVANTDGCIFMVKLSINIRPLRFYQNFIFSIYQNESTFRNAQITSTTGFDITKFFFKVPLDRKPF